MRRESDLPPAVQTKMQLPSMRCDAFYSDGSDTYDVDA
jgi:hypothetical protein